ncbi:MAG: alpha/beta hydrolase [Bryobacteraceae bacterium]
MRRMGKWLGYLAGALLSLSLLLACVGFIYEQCAEGRDRRLNHPPGQLVDVGGYSMHLYCTGQGSPTVVLDSGLGEYWISWYKIQPQLSLLTRVCSYDRAGLGWSNSSPQNRTSKVFAQELHTLLQRAAIPGPYILVGHSLGGMNVRMFADLYPANVVGMVLVDSSYPRQDQRLPPEINQVFARFQREFDMHALGIPIGIPRLMGWCGSAPPELHPMALAVECQRQYFREVHEEWAHFDEDGDQLRVTAPLGKMPLIVLSHDPDKLLSGVSAGVARAVNKAWESMQLELTRLSTNGVRVIAKGSTHYIQIDRPDVVIQAVQNVLSQCREARQSAYEPGSPFPASVANGLRGSGETLLHQ